MLAEFFSLRNNSANPNISRFFPYFCLSNATHGQNINLPVCVCVCVCVCVRHTFCQLTYRSDPSTDFYSW